MSTATLPAPPAPATRPPELTGLLNYADSGRRLLVTDVSWAEFERLLFWRDEHRKMTVRFAYDRGDLEIMTVSNYHERLKKLLGILIEAWIEETGGDYAPSGDLTHLRADLEKGFEPDGCYYVQNAPKVYGLREIDFAVDPPPDLAVEVEASRSILNKLPIYAAFKVPEIWRYDGKRLTVLLLEPDGSYRESPVSRALPALQLAELPRFLEMVADVTVGYATIGRRFRSWVRANLPAPPG